MATKRPTVIGTMYVEVFRRIGCKEVKTFDVADRAHAAAAGTAAKFEEVSGVFFTGGNQVRITHQLGGTPIDTLLHRRRAAGLTVGGTSPGAAVMSGTMIVGGVNESPPRDGAVEVGPGLDLLRGVMVDQHFTRRGRTGRLLAALARYPHLLGVGIDEDTALVAEGGDFRVVGSGAVTVFDLGNPLGSNALELTAGQHMGICDVRMNILPEGYRFRIADRTTLPPPNRSPVHSGDTE